ncbi:MAG: YidC/Oxa1 family membrane protein insertase [Alphaproteobacteria bacterium]|nr:YidC/Oxa1 family membrane protein insertase [Alphaproteobacteria bacterium]
MFLYNIFIAHFVYCFDVLAFILDRLLSNSVFLLFIISFVVNFLSYPVFKKIEDMCKKDNDDYQKLLPKINSIKTNFSGNERRMLLETYFRQNKYHPLLARFKQSLSVFLYVPIFAASYIVISKNPLFENATLNRINEAFLPIRILPVLMTLINVVSVLIYTKNKPSLNKVYSYILPLLFLVLLYFSPASVVLYWIFNNSFSLLRNIYFFAKDKFSGCLIGYISVVFSVALYDDFSVKTLFDALIIALIALGIKVFVSAMKDNFYLFVVFFFVAIGFFIYFFKIYYLDNAYFSFEISVFLLGLLITVYRFLVKNMEFEVSFKSYFLLLFSMFVLFGFYFPLKIVFSDPEEVYSVIDFEDLVLYEIEFAFGLFLIYPSIVFFLQKRNRKNIYWLTLTFFVLALMECGLFRMPHDPIDAYMHFSITFSFPPSFPYAFETFLIFIIVSAMPLFLRKKTQKYLNLFLIAFISVCLYFSVVWMKGLYIEAKRLKDEEQNHSKVELTLTSKGKNVLILFMDRAISSFFPLVMKEKPELKKAFEGFVYYPYMVSFAPHTLHSVPSLLGGYEYTPLKLQGDTTREMADKHNEAISVLPELFRRNGYKVALNDIPYINYDDNRRKGFFHKDISMIDTNGMKRNRIKEVEKHIKESIPSFMLFRAVPQSFKEFIYNRGKYIYEKYKITNLVRIYAMNEYDLFEDMISNLTVKSDAPDSFSIFISLLPHSPTFLSKNYDFANDTDWISKKNMTVCHYHVNVLSYIEIGKLIRKLKENNVYDNTRIIVVSDHGAFLDVDNVNIPQNNALLLFKDFNAKGEYKTSSDFMTTADVPYLSAYGLIEPLVNPLSGKKIYLQKEEGVDIIVSMFGKWHPRHYKDKKRTYFYDEEVRYIHIDENNIKQMIKADPIQ